jgi:hypothetical protein
LLGYSLWASELSHWQCSELLSTANGLIYSTSRPGCFRHGFRRPLPVGQPRTFPIGSGARAVGLEELNKHGNWPQQGARGVLGSSGREACSTEVRAPQAARPLLCQRGFELRLRRAPRIRHGVLYLRAPLLVGLLPVTVLGHRLLRRLELRLPHEPLVLLGLGGGGPPTRRRLTPAHRHAPARPALRLQLSPRVRAARATAPRRSTPRPAAAAGDALPVCDSRAQIRVPGNGNTRQAKGLMLLTAKLTR